MKNDREESIKAIEPFYDKDSWIIDGTSRHLLAKGFVKADKIYLLTFKYIFVQYYFLIRRYFGRKHERLQDIWDLLKHVTRRRYKKGYAPTWNELLIEHKAKVIELSTFKEIKKVLTSY